MGHTPVQFWRDEMFSLIQDSKIKDFGKDERLDKKNSKSDWMGYSIAKQNLSRSKKSNDPPLTIDKSMNKLDQSKESNSPVIEDHNENPIMRFILYNFEISDHTNAEEYSKLINLLAMNDQICTLAR